MSSLSCRGPASSGIPRNRQLAETRETPGSAAVRQRKRKKTMDLNQTVFNKNLMDDGRLNMENVSW
jgi:hypothetical protein